MGGPLWFLYNLFFLSPAHSKLILLQTQRRMRFRANLRRLLQFVKEKMLVALYVSGKLTKGADGVYYSKDASFGFQYMPKANLYLMKVDKNNLRDVQEPPTYEKIYQARDGGWRWGIMTTNGSESLNAVLVEVEVLKFTKPFCELNSKTYQIGSNDESKLLNRSTL